MKNCLGTAQPWPDFFTVKVWTTLFLGQNKFTRHQEPNFWFYKFYVTAVHKSWFRLQLAIFTFRKGMVKNDFLWQFSVKSFVYFCLNYWKPCKIKINEHLIKSETCYWCVCITINNRQRRLQFLVWENSDFVE